MSVSEMTHQDLARLFGILWIGAAGLLAVIIAAVAGRVYRAHQLRKLRDAPTDKSIEKLLDDEGAGY
jgi:hypothetical protein